MIVLSIKSDIDKWKEAIARLENMARMEMDDLPFRCAGEFIQLVKTNVMTSKFRFKGYNQRYWLWKKMMYGWQPQWRLSGDMLAALMVDPVRITKNEKGYAGGVPAGVMDRGGKSWYGSPGRVFGRPKEIAKYAAIVEEDRPLFQWTTEQYEKDKWPSQGDITLSRLKACWR